MLLRFPLRRNCRIAVLAAVIAAMPAAAFAQNDPRVIPPPKAQKKLPEAIALLKLNVEFYPNAWNVYDSLAEAYMTNGEKELAIANYKKSLELNPQNANGREMLKKLGQ